MRICSKLTRSESTLYWLDIFQIIHIDFYHNITPLHISSWPFWIFFLFLPPLSIFKVHLRPQSIIKREGFSLDFKKVRAWCITMCLLQRRKDRDVFKVSAYTTNLVQFGHEVQETKMDKTILRNPSHSLESCSDNKKVCCIQKLVRLRPFDYRGALFRSSLPSGAVLYYYKHQGPRATTIWSSKKRSK